MCRGIPLKGQLCIRTEFGKQGKRKREEGNREEREREREAEDEMLMATGNKRNSHRGQRKTQSTV